MTKFKEWDKFKKVVYIIIVILIIVRILYIVVGKDLDMEYNTSSPASTSYTEMPCNGIDTEFSTQEKRINSFEFIFNNINEDKKGAVICKVTHNNDVIYQANISLKNINNNEWWKVYVNIPVKPGDEYHIILDADKDCTDTPNILLVPKDKGCAENIITSSKGGDAGGTLAIHYGYLDAPGKADLIVGSSLWIILLIIITYIFMYSGALTNTIVKMMDIAGTYIDKTIGYIFFELSLFFVVVYTSGVPFEKPMKIMLFATSVIASAVFVKKYDSYKKFCDKTWKRNVIVFLCLLGSFCIVGQRIFIYPLSIKPTLSGILVYLLTAVWILPIISMFMNILYLCSDVFVKNKRISKYKLLFIMMVLLLLPALYNLFANNPGMSTGDTLVSMVNNAHHLYGMYDWHPAFYCMVLSAIQHVWDSTYAVIIVQYFFWAYVNIELFMYLRKKGINDSVIIAVAALLGISAANFIHINTIWKDIPYALSVMWLVVILGKLSIDFELYNKKWYVYVELVVALLGTYLYRKNGFVTFIFVAISIFVVLRKNRKAVISIMIAMILIGVIKGQVYSHFGVRETGRNGMYIGLSQDILGVYYAGGDVSEDTLQMINVMTGNNNAEYGYDPTFAGQTYDLVVAPRTFIANYLDTFVKNPVLLIRALIDREDLAWDVIQGEDCTVGCTNCYCTEDGQGDWNKYYPARVYRSLFSPMLQFTTYTANNQCISSIEWRAGLLMLLSWITGFYLIMKRGFGEYLIIFVPVVGHFMSLVLSTGWTDFRYYWPLNLMNFSIILLSLVIINSKSCTESDKFRQEIGE